MNTSKMVKKFEGAEYHRNGIAGQGFTVALFTMKDGHKRRNMVAILFDADGDDDGLKFTGQCAVLDRDMLAAGNVTFGENSWRGDEFEVELRPLVKKCLDDKYAALEAKWQAEAEASRKAEAEADAKRLAEVEPVVEKAGE